MSVVLAGARRIREQVVVPMRIVDWVFTDLDGEVVIYADQYAIFVFDLVQRRLHKLVGESYSFNDITEIRRHGTDTIARVRLDVASDVAAGLTNAQASHAALTRLVELTAMHPATQTRVRRLLQAYN